MDQSMNATLWASVNTGLRMSLASVTLFWSCCITLLGLLCWHLPPPHPLTHCQSSAAAKDTEGTMEAYWTQFWSDRQTLMSSSACLIINNSWMDVEELNEVKISLKESEKFTVFLSILDKFDFTSRQNKMQINKMQMLYWKVWLTVAAGLQCKGQLLTSSWVLENCYSSNQPNTWMHDGSNHVMSTIGTLKVLLPWILKCDF